MINAYDVDPLKKAKYFINDCVLVRKYDCYLIGKIIDILGKLSNDCSISYKINISIIDCIHPNAMIKSDNITVDETDIVKTFSLSTKILGASIKESTPGYLFDINGDCTIINTYNNNLRQLNAYPSLYEGIFPEYEKNLNTKFKKNDLVRIKGELYSSTILDTSFISIDKDSFGDRVYLISKNISSTVSFITFVKESILEAIPSITNVHNKIDNSPVEVIIGNDNNTKDDSFKFNNGDIVKFKQREMIDGYILDTIYFKIEDRFTIKGKKYYALSVIDYIYTNECGIIIRAEDQLELIIDKLDDYNIHGYNTGRLLWKIKKFEE